MSVGDRGEFMARSAAKGAPAASNASKALIAHIRDRLQL